MRDLDGSGRRAYACAIALGLVLGAAGDVRAQEQQPEQPDTASTDTTEHVVRPGDTLWDLAGQYYENHYIWPMIAEANFGVVEDPHWIYPRERLLIPGLLAGVRLPDRLAPRPRGGDPLLQPYPIRRTAFWNPVFEARRAGATTVITEPESTERAVRPGEFRAAPWLAPASRLPVVARLASAVEPALAAEIARPAISRFDEVLLSPEGGRRPAVADRLLLVRPERRIGGWGRLIRPVALVRVAAEGDELITAEVIEHYDRIDDGDLAIPPAAYPVPEGVQPQPVEEGAAGRIIAFTIEQPLYGVTDIAFLDLGQGDGLEVGDEFVAYLPPRRVQANGSRSTPSEPVAELRVLRVTDRTATARVTVLRHPVLEPGLPVRLVRKMP